MHRPHPWFNSSASASSFIHSFQSIGRPSINRSIHSRSFEQIIELALAAVCASCFIIQEDRDDRRDRGIGTEQTNHIYKLTRGALAESMYIVYTLLYIIIIYSKNYIHYSIITHICLFNQSQNVDFQPIGHRSIYSRLTLILESFKLMSNFLLQKIILIAIFPAYFHMLECFFIDYSSRSKVGLVAL
jgi:hypothetical protein